MSLWKTGSVTVINGSQIVTGANTLFLANVTIGDDFKVSGENADYTVASVDSNTQITLSANYAGTTQAGAVYSISRDFTSLYGLTEIQSGDTDWPYRVTKALRKIDTLLAIGGLLYSGTATSSTTNTITKTGAGWGVNVFADMILKITSGAASGAVVDLSSNTADTLTFPTITGLTGAITFEIYLAWIPQEMNAFDHAYLSGRI